MQNDFETNFHIEHPDSEDSNSIHIESPAYLNEDKTKEEQQNSKYTLETIDVEQTIAEDTEMEMPDRIPINEPASRETSNDQNADTVFYKRTTQENSSNQLETYSTKRQYINNHKEERRVSLDLKTGEIPVDSEIMKTSEKKQKPTIAGNKPEFAAEITNTTGKLNETVQLICRTENVKQRVEWYFNGQLIYDSDPTYYRVVNHTDGTRILRISKLQDRHNGVYMCEASNEFGSTNMKAYITVLG